MKVKIVDYDHLGRGIAKENGKVIFVPKVKKDRVVDMDIVTSKKKYAIGKAKEETLENSIFCPHFFDCGGCQLQHLTEEEQLAFKQEKVKNILAKYANYQAKRDIPIIKSQYKQYRNKVTLHIEGKKVGFYQEQTHTIFELQQCPILEKEIEKMIDLIQKFVRRYSGLTEVMIRYLNEQIMLSFKGTTDRKIIIDYFSTLADSIYYNGQWIAGKEKLLTKIFDKTYQVSSEAFFQVNTIGLEKIYSQALDFLPKEKDQMILDLYCGTGTITLLLADYAKKVIGIEINEQAIMDAKENAKINQIENVEFYAGSTADILPNITDKIDVIVVDPPRQGLDKITKEQIIKRLPKQIIYISCDAITFARDIKDLSEFYQLADICLVDEFPQTYHVESLALLERKNVEK